MDERFTGKGADPSRLKKQAETVRTGGWKRRPEKRIAGLSKTLRRMYRPETPLTSGCLGRFAKVGEIIRQPEVVDSKRIGI
ncbi:hypothetical protein [Aeoliella sp.]|uniref:hypothetical protein n=1 Tax=Aeoliella sp. TaxID=2795800 RepID=UPI003CCBA96A